MDIEIKYMLFDIVNGNLIGNRSYSYTVITVSEGLDIDTPEGLAEVNSQLSRIINKPRKQFKIISGTLV